MAFGKSITCPCCFREYPLSDIVFQCLKPGCAAPIFKPRQSVTRSLTGQTKPVLAATCPSCNTESFKRVCPNCKYELMNDTGLIEEYTIAVIGGRASGKSNYIATIVHQLENEIGDNFDASVLARGDKTRERYDRDFRNPLYGKHQLITPTRSGQVDENTKVPMVFRITFNNKGKQKAANLVLFDTAGEDMASLDLMTTEALYICHADAIIFLLDPLQIDAVRQQLPASVLPLEIPESNPVAIVSRLRELFERKYGYSSKQKIHPHMAFTISKIDTLFPLIDPGSPLRSTGEHFGRLNLADINAVNSELTAYLQSWIGNQFNKLVRDNFESYIYCGVSALGRNPVNNRLDSITSIRVEDPLLWIFYKLGFIQAK